MRSRLARNLQGLPWETMTLCPSFSHSQSGGGGHHSHCDLAERVAEVWGSLDSSHISP